MTLEKILNHRGDPVAEPSEFSQAYSDGVDGWVFWASGVPLNENRNTYGEVMSRTRYHNEGIKPPRPYVLDAQELKVTLAEQGIDEAVSVLYRIYPGGKSECTIRVGRFFNDSGYWHVAEVIK